MRPMTMAAALLTGLSLLLLSPAAPSAAGDEREQVRKACLDYVEGFYQSSQARIEGGVHPDLVKRRVTGGTIHEMTRQQLVDAALARRPTSPEIRVEILDLYASRGIASAKILSDYVDYAQLARIDGRWQVINVLWDLK